MIDYQEICGRAETVIAYTGESIRKESAGFDLRLVESKGLNDFVSYVDKESERSLVDKLSLILPDAGFITEEGTSSKDSGKYRWVIDPLDGTTNFLHNLHPFAISVALTEDNEPVAGVVYEIGGNETFKAWKGGGAWLNGNRIRVSSAGSLSDSLVATGFPYNDFSRLEKYMNFLSFLCRNTHGIRRLGSASIDLAYVACGRFEAFFEYDLKPWDVAAGVILVREAGGCVSDFSGNNENITGKEIAAANRMVFPEFLENVSKFMR
ncbi:MAG: inositol monophosphatase family protein [Bacteroidales bacterium]|jgi:myo-inositol-1(or 4)-monophosphatase